MHHEEENSEKLENSSLNDTKNVLNPTKLSRPIDGSLYIPGVVGLNNIKANDYCNAVLQALTLVNPLRNDFSREENCSNVKRPSMLLQRFGELMRKLWNPRNFTEHVNLYHFFCIISTKFNGQTEEYKTIYKRKIS
ncbi:unnamed protein product [Phyllotreta striolata]|uniref:ubiquitinyl hydrolase 1 n=1 Tax=Phyllotreta striolata TaxID=444603 RepID=A0A9N9XLZ1_PHYSR|nr:unnamed protein product [Phyllotreta striolata]